jgi:hypothetical protein
VEGEDSAGRQSGRRVTVDEAARHLGLTVDALSKRVQRGLIAHEKDSAGRVRVILDESETLQDESPDTTGPAAELVEELRDRVRYLERQVEEEREARRRANTILAQLSRANEEQARTIRAIEAPQEPSESPESPAPSEKTPTSTTGSGAQEGTEAAESRPGSVQQLWENMAGNLLTLAVVAAGATIAVIAWILERFTISVLAGVALMVYMMGFILRDIIRLRRNNLPVSNWNYEVLIIGTLLLIWLILQALYWGRVYSPYLPVVPIGYLPIGTLDLA